MSLFNLFRRARKPDLDDSVLVQLRKAGSNLSKPHAIEFFLYFPTQAIAEQAATQVRDAGFEVRLEPSAKGNDWLCFATKNMVPELAAMQEIRHKFNSLASSMGGEYDGWGTEVEK
jgi:regulator of RNase E activity RraB